MNKKSRSAAVVSTLVLARRRWRWLRCKRTRTMAEEFRDLELHPKQIKGWKQ
jgi:hypothetical protein